MNSFSDLNIDSGLKTQLSKLEFNQPTPIQAKVIPLVIEGNDVLATAPTGTGKTLAFGLPMMTQLINRNIHSALILTPTRELAIQILKEFKKISNQFKSVLLIGGEPFHKQLRDLKANPRVIIGTPGRVMDHIERGKLSITKTDYLVLDETDRMLDMGFAMQINPIIETMPKEKQTVLFSATLPHKLRLMAKKYLNNPKEISAGTLNAPAKKIKQHTTHLEQKDKFKHLNELMQAHPESKIVFVATKRSCDQIATTLSKKGHRAEALHGDLNQGKRKRVTQAFHSGKFNTLIATDVAARGLDIPHVEHVINFDLPYHPEDYIHRIGRTARADQDGSAWNLVSAEDKFKWNAIERFISSEGKDHTSAKQLSRKSNTKSRKEPWYKTKSKKPASSNSKKYFNKKK
ncbi:MAG: ATP-dependent RNA helicase [Legionellales bacterium]|nr:ATP-dependent RNA helicase [Legionellales bacterium]OUX65441.1 MAG: hypothetical protein CBE41_01625 [Gammaproteobacteria bacterium TMED281]